MIQAYAQLVDDTLTYIRGLLPKKENFFFSPIAVEKTKEIIPKTCKPSPDPDKPQTTSINQKTIKKERLQLELHPPSCPSTSLPEKMSSLLKTIAPNLYIYDKPPSDEKAKRIKNAWKDKSQIPAIPILFQGRMYRPFLDNLARAITLHFGSSLVIDITAFEKEKKWDIFLESPQIQLVLCPDYLIFSSKQLLLFYKEHPTKKVHFLKNIPLLLLPDLSLYYKDPYLKRSLWNVICQTLH